MWGLRDVTGKARNDAWAPGRLLALLAGVPHIFLIHLWMLSHWLPGSRYGLTSQERHTTIIFFTVNSLDPHSQPQITFSILFQSTEVLFLPKHRAVKSSLPSPTLKASFVPTSMTTVHVRFSWLSRRSISRVLTLPNTATSLPATKHPEMSMGFTGRRGVYPNGLERGSLRNTVWWPHLALPPIGVLGGEGRQVSRACHTNKPSLHPGHTGHWRVHFSEIH